MAGNELPQENAAWAVVELFRHVRLAGRLSEEERFGTKLGRIDVPQEDGTFVTRYFGGAAVYGVTPVTEAVARQVAKGVRPEPVQPWDYPRLFGPPVCDDEGPDDEGPDDGDSVTF